MKIANIELGERALLLAPMEDVTDPSFRYMCKRFGADMVYTEFISSDGLIRDAAKSLKKLEIDDAERPVGIQIYGHLIDPMVEAARMAEAAGPDVIDINFGCPVKKIAGRGAGSGMMRDVPLMVEMTRRIVAAVKKPVTVKTRLGWDEESKNIEEIALRLQDVGIAALTIHGRTRAQMYRGEADWTLIGKVKNNPQIRIPIIGNGDVDSGPKAREMFDRYGVDGVMIGRATYGRPWIFREVKHFLSTGEALPQPSVAERVAIAKEHLQKSLEIKGDHVGILEMRRHMTNYFKGLPDFKPTRLKLVTSLDIPELFDTLDTTTRRWRIDAAQEGLLSDTVGFIRKLPTHLVEAFKATLEELTYADVLLHVIDLSNPEWEAQAEVVDRLIDQLGAAQTPCIRVFNKCDAYLGILPHGENIVCISARSGEGAAELTECVRAILGRADHHVTLLLPYAQGALLETLHRDCAVLHTDYRDDGIALEVIIHPEQWTRFEPFVIAGEEG